MKKFFSFVKLFSTCLFIFYILPSWNDSATNKNSNDNIKAPPPQIVINISDGDTSTGKLTMKLVNNRNAHIILAEHGQTILWQLHPNPVVSKIDTIIQKAITNNFNIFSALSRVGNSQNWHATIAQVSDNPYEWYDIKWTDAFGHSRTYDPLIQVNPAIIPLTTDSSGR